MRFIELRCRLVKLFVRIYRKRMHDDWKENEQSWLNLVIFSLGRAPYPSSYHLDFSSQLPSWHLHHLQLNLQLEIILLERPGLNRFDRQIKKSKKRQVLILLFNRTFLFLLLYSSQYGVQSIIRISLSYPFFLNECLIEERGLYLESSIWLPILTDINLQIAYTFIGTLETDHRSINWYHHFSTIRMIKILEEVI